MILEEAFGVAPAALFPDIPRPRTVAELAAATGQTPAVIVHKIKELLRLSEQLEIDPEELQQSLASAAEPPILLDVREPWEFAICHLPGSLLLAELGLAALLARLQAAPLVVTVCHHGVRSVSAAIYLRQHGVASARSLAGGVDAWAQSIDPRMPRY
jgi:rhodanese-related sulfurtransferase